MKQFGKVLGVTLAAVVISCIGGILITPYMILQEKPAAVFNTLGKLSPDQMQQLKAGNFFSAHDHSTVSFIIAPANSKITRWDGGKFASSWRADGPVEPGYWLRLGDSQGHLIEYRDYGADGSLESRTAFAITTDHHQLSSFYDATNTIVSAEDIDLTPDGSGMLTVSKTTYSAGNPTSIIIALREKKYLGQKFASIFDIGVEEITYLPNGTIKRKSLKKG